jgi:hypothetical protein
MNEKRARNMIQNLGRNRILWLFNATLSLIAAFSGVLRPSIYSAVVSAEILPGVISQDLLTVLAAVILLFFTLRGDQENSKKQIAILGLLGYLFYAYGIYAIEQVYNVLYFLYLAIFGLSFYSLIYAVASIRREILEEVQVRGPIRKTSVGFSLFIAILFSVLWIAMLVPLIQTGQRIEYTYSIYILDLSFIMPAFAILAVMTARNRGLGLLLTPALYILGATLLFPVGLGEIIKPFFNLPIDLSGVPLYFGISVLFFVLVVIYLRNLKIPA